MKKYIVMVLLGAATGVLQAATTCEMRVDKHPGASTRQRVEYCLTQESAETPKEKGPVLLYSKITRAPRATQEEATRARKQVYFEDEEVAIARKYVGTNRFPVFQNEIPSEQERQTQPKTRASFARPQDKQVKAEKEDKPQPVVVIEPEKDKTVNNSRGKKTGRNKKSKTEEKTGLYSRIRVNGEEMPEQTPTDADDIYYRAFR